MKMYEIRFTDYTGERDSVTFDTLREAQAYVETLRKAEATNIRITTVYLED